MSEALYRKYRSKSFKEVIGQEHITTSLLNSIKNGTFAHAYLLTGPHGVGKTSVARLFAHQVNGLDYTLDTNNTDIIEIDAASNRRIDEIRELREKVNIAPTSLKYKVYIVDEVHMLTKEAFNALLKTLEEPPEHVIFVLATTDFHKVPDTIASRCVRFAFQPISADNIKKHLKNIADQESINIEAGALEVIAENSEGSFRDAISLLDQFRNSSQSITADYVSKILGLSPEKSISELLVNVADSEPKKIIDILDQLRNSGSSDGQIIKQLINHLRQGLIQQNNEDISRDKAIGIIEDLLKINNYTNTKLALEISLLKACSRAATAKKASEPVQENETLPKPILEISEPPNVQDDLWISVLDSLKSNNNTLYGIARMAEVKYDGDNLELHFDFPFHFKQMKLEKNFLIIEQTVGSLGKNIKEIKLYTKQKPKSDYQPEMSKKTAKEPVSDISNIFGPSEVLES